MTLIPEVMMQEDGTVKMIKKKATVLSIGAGDYTYVDDIIENMLEFSKFTGEMIGCIVSVLVKN